MKKIDWTSNFFPRACLALLRKRVPTRDVCIVRPGGLGDLVLLTRAAMHRGISLNDVTWVVERRNAIWLEYLGVSNFILYDSLSAVLKFLCSQSFKRVFCSEQTFGLAGIFCYLLAARQGCLVGFSSNRRFDLFDCSVDYSLERPEIGEFLALLEIVGVVEFVPAEEASSTMPQVNSAPFGILALGGAFNYTKRLSITEWVKFCRKALQYSEHLTILGAPYERRLGLQIARHFGSRVSCLAGQITFRETVDLIRGASRVYGVDSGLIHVADFFQIPTTVVFVSSSAKKWAPRHTESQIIQRDEL